MIYLSTLENHKVNHRNPKIILYKGIKAEDQKGMTSGSLSNDDNVQ